MTARMTAPPIPVPPSTECAELRPRGRAERPLVAPRTSNEQSTQIRVGREYGRPSDVCAPPSACLLRFGFVLASSIALAATLVRVYRGLDSFWLPLAVAFISRPDLGPLIPRALARTIGTLVEVAIAAAVAAAGNSVLLLIVLSCLMAAAVPWASRRSHALTVIAFTPIVFVFLSVLGPDQYLFVPRIVDTAVGAAIVLVMDTVFWSTAPSLRPEAQLDRSREAVAAYRRCDAGTSAAERHLGRRLALRAIADARVSVETALGEPLARRRPDRAALGELDRLSSSIDAHTMSIVTALAR